MTVKELLDKLPIESGDYDIVFNNTGMTVYQLLEEEECKISKVDVRNEKVILYS